MRTADRRNRGSGELREEYDFSGGVRGKYAVRYARGSNVVVLAPDVAEVFRTAKAVNKALRSQLSTGAAPGRDRRKRRKIRAALQPGRRKRRKARGAVRPGRRRRRLART